MLAEQVENNPLDLNLLGFCYEPKVNIDNTVRGWTLLPQRAPLLHELFSDRIVVRRELFRSGYSTREIARNERPEVSIEAVRQSTLSIPRYFWPTRLREIFPSRGTKWGTDDLIFVLRDMMNGLTQSEIVGKYGANRSRLINKRDGLISVGFPIPPLMDKPGLMSLQKSDDWISLRAGLVEVMQRRLRTMGILYDGLKERGFEVMHKVHGGNYYFMRRGEIKRLTAIYEASPEIFVETKTWSSRTSVS